MSEYIGDIREAMPDAWALGRPSRTLVTSTVFLELIQMHMLPSSRLRQTQSLNKQDISVLFCYVLFPSVRSVLFCSVLLYSTSHEHAVIDRKHEHAVIDRKHRYMLIELMVPQLRH